MLRLIDIKKDYVMKDQEPVHALRGVNVNFRRNEFVAILGPSGCGKTTLLNIVGGLDHYTSGDLIIQGTSTKNYDERDWDTYRNHSIGFVFQSYNLIGHRNILSNVELALTISGVDKKERRERAFKALEIVGLKGLEKKKPNQLSGGQMQRVAIARALVNNPEILLADEPTGALDSETSIQIMDLLKEVAKDRLVIMVTHNPDLANEYATRIVTMKDGVLTGDSNPYQGESEEERAKAHEVINVNKGKKERTSMSFLTATGLSMSNLLSKMKRTVLVAIAGSIGIIGVSAVLAVSNGVSNFVNDMQDDMISQYPLSIAESSIDVTSLLNGLSNDEKKEIFNYATTNNVGIDSMIAYLMEKYHDFTTIKTNDINDNLVAYINQMPKEYYSSINHDYSIDLTNNIFAKWNRGYPANPERGYPADKDQYISLNGLTQMYISELTTVEGFDSYAYFVNLFTNFMKQIPGDKDYILSQYDIVAGTYPEKDTDLALVVDENQTLTDLVYAQMGYFNEDEFLSIAKKAVEENSENPDPEKIKEYDKRYPKTFEYDQILGKKLKYYQHDDIWEYHEIPVNYVEFDIDFSSLGIDNAHFKLAYNEQADCLDGKIRLSNIESSIIFNRKKDTVIDEAHKERGVWEGTIMGKYYLSFTIDEENATVTSVDLLTTPERYKGKYKSTDTVDSDLFSFKVELNKTEVVFILRYNADLGNITGYLKGDEDSDFALTRLTPIDPSKPDNGEWYGMIGGSIPFAFKLIDDQINIHVASFDPAPYTSTTDTVIGPMYNASISIDDQVVLNRGTDISVTAILKKKPNIRFGCLNRGVYHTKEFTAKFMADSKDSQLVKTGFYNQDNGKKQYDSLEEFINSYKVDEALYPAYVRYEYTSFKLGDDEKSIVRNVPGFAGALNADLNSSLSSLVSISNKPSYADSNKTYLRSVSGLATKDLENVSVFSTEKYEFKALPKNISIRPKNFETKDEVVEYLKDWNSDKPLTINGKAVPASDRKELTYTDTVELIVSIIKTMITVVTVALVSFTSLALIVSCFMIAVITYISTMERVKEIGVIRSLGGRKKDVSRLFIAECLITGLASGVIGIAFTYLSSIILNIAVSSFNVGQIANLPILWALIMVVLSIFLNVISGFIPARSASKQDPVIALRTE